MVIKHSYREWDPTGAALNARTLLTSSIQSHQEGKWTSYCQLVNYPTNIYATDDIIAEPYVYITDYEELQDLNVVDYSQSLWTQALQCGLLYD